MKIKKSKNLLKTTVPLSVALVLAGGLVWFINRKPTINTSTVTPASNIGTDGVNYNPPTEQDIKEAEQNKEKLGNKDTPPTTTPSNTANIVITYAGQYDQDVEVAFYVSNVYEDDGTCSVTLTNGSLSVTKDTKGFKDVRTTVCPPIVIPRAEFPTAGQWTAVVSYTSQTANGTSEQRIIEIK